MVQVIKKEELDEKNVEDILALTPPQEGMLFHYLKDPQQDPYFEQLCLELSGEINVEYFEKAWNVVVDTNEMLRTLFHWEKMKYPIQVVLKKHHITPLYHDFSNMHPGEKEKLTREVKINDRKKKFDLQKIPWRITLCKMGKNQYEMIISNHHILYDGWSNGIILQEFFNAYNDLSKGKELIKPAKTKFKEFIHWGQTQQNKKEERFWREYLKGFDTPTGLSIKKRKTGKITKTGNYQVFIHKDKKDELDGFIKKHKITLASLLYTAWGFLLQKYSNTGDVIFGTTVSGRSANIKGIENMIGLFINTLPFRVQTNPNEKIINLLHRTNESLQIRKEYEYSSLVKIKEYSDLDSNEAFFDTVVVIENYPLHRHLLQKNENSKLSLNSCSISEMTNYDLTAGISISQKIEVKLIYNARIFADHDITRLANHFRCITENMIKNPGKPVPDIEMISPEEKKHLLYDFSHLNPGYSTGKTIHELFAQQVEQTPDHIALTGQIPKGVACGDMQLSYRKLNEQTNRLAHLLKNKGTQPDTIVGIIVERSIEMVPGILGILKSGAAYLPINPKNPTARIQFMLKDSNAKILLSGVNELSKVNEEIELIDLNKIELNKDLPISPTHLTQFPHLTRLNLAYVVYTSGSTGNPKGVLISHSNFSQLVHWGYDFGIGPGDRVIQNLSYYFDWSVWEIFIALTTGAGLFMITEEIVLNPGAEVDFILEKGINVLHITPTHYQYLVKVGKKLTPMKYLFIGAEKLTYQLVKRSRESINKECRLFNMYGPTEATIISATLEIDPLQVEKYEELTSVPIGKPTGNTVLLVLDRYLKMCPIGVVGELYIGGEGVAAGYLNNPELTSEKFERTVISHSSPGISSPSKCFPNHQCLMINDRFYKTGDRVRWLADGTVEFLGRADFQVKIRGYRIELSEIENRLLDHDAVREAVVIDREYEKGEKFLCVYIVPVKNSKFENRESMSRELSGYLSVSLPDYMIPSYFVFLDNIPLTPNGKLDRKALPEPETRVLEDYTAPRHELEEKLAEIWTDVLGRTSIGIDHNFFRVGGHSLNATRLISRIHKVFDVRLPLDEIFKNPSIRKLSAQIKQALTDKYQTIAAVEKKEYYALSSAQQRLYILAQMENESSHYNISGAFMLEYGVQADRLENAFRQLIQRHESLRTSFHLAENQPVQKVHDKVKFEIEYYDLATVERQTTDDRGQTTENRSEDPGDPRGEPCVRPESYIHSFIRPFDLSRAPLLRVGLKEVDKEKYLLMVDMHHIISDGFSIGIMQREMAALYDSERLPLLKIQYKDYCMWQKREIEKGKFHAQKVYWLNQFPGEIPVLALPYDYIRPSMQDFEGKTMRFELAVGESGTLKELAKKEGTTLYTVILAIYTILLAKLGNQEDVVVGTPVAGRRHEDLEQIAAVFINTLALRNFPSGQKTFKGFLKEVKEKTLDALENQDYPLEELVNQVIVTREVSRNPLFDVLFALQELEKPEPEPSGLKLMPLEFESSTSILDISLQAFDAGKKLLFKIEYKTKLFKQETIQRFVNYFINIITQVVNDPGIRIAGIDILPGKEKHQLLYEFNETQTGYPKEKTISELFAEQAETTPGNIALHGCMDAWMHGEGHITYGELNEKSYHLAGLLKEKGVKPDTIVGIMGKRSVEMVIAILGILKAGGAYLPIDPDYPLERIDYMLTDSNVGVLLTTPKLQVKVKTEVEENSRQPQQLSLQMIDIDPELASVFEPSHSTLTSTSTCQVSPTNLAYIIYTSGSTGKPKGTLIRHRNAARLVKNSNYIDFSPGDRLLMTGALTFDITTFEIWGALLNGISLYITDQSTITNADKLGKAITRNQVSILHLVPQLFNQVAAEDIEIFAGLRYFLVGGDLVKPQYINELRRKSSQLKILHMYGPTENTTFSTFFPVEKSCETRLPIGKPISHSLVYILDRHGKLQPIGVVGELCTGGDGVARGYLNNPELTAEKFIELEVKVKVEVEEAEVPREQITNYKLQTLMQPCSHAAIHHYSPLPRHPIYLTGDLARWLPDGNIEFLGRMDHQVKIRGIRIEPGEIEKKLMEIDYIKDAVVIDRQDSKGEKYLVAYVVSNKDEDVNVTGLKNGLAEVLPTNMIPSFFVHLQEIPLTPNGKTDRESLPHPGIGTAVQYAPPRDEVESRLVRIWSDILARDPVHASHLQASLGIDHNFFEVGGHSLRAALLLYRVSQAFDIKFSLSKIFKGPTIREMARLVKNSKENIYQDIKPVEKRDFYPLSSAQKRLFFLEQMEDIGTSYNIPSVHRLKGKPGKKRYEDCFKALIKRHEALRTSFVLINNHPVQQVHDKVGFKIEYYEPESSVNNEGEEREEVEKIIQNFIRPFNLAKAPLLRVGFIVSPAIGTLLLFDIHHIIGDGTSTGILIDDFKQLYTGEKLMLLKVQYKDFSIWQNNLFETGKIKSQENYWLDLLSGEIPVLDLLPDNPRPPVLSFGGGNYRFFLEKEYTEKYLLLCEEMGATLYMNLLASFNVLFFKYTHMEDIIVGTGIMGRPHVDLQKIVGMFVNTLVMRNYPRGDQSYWEFFRQVKENSLNAFENQDVQFEELVRQLNLERDPSRNPIFDVTIVVQNFERSTISAPGITIEPYNMENKTSKFDLTLFTYEDEVKHRLAFNFEYAAKLFERKTVEKIANHFIEIIKQVIRSKHIMLKDISLTHAFLDSQAGNIEDEQGDFGF